MRPAALIFDCDGTLADTMPAHYEAWVATLSHYHFALDEDLFYAMGGWPTLKVAEHLLEKAGVVMPAERIVEEKEALFAAMLGSIQPILPVIEIASQHRGVIPMSVGSGGLKHLVVETLRHLRIDDWFHSIVTCEDVQNHKPHPDTYLEAARRMNVDPAACVVYEDTDPGIEAGQRAGMQVIDVRTLYTPRRVTMR